MVKIVSSIALIIVSLALIVRANPLALSNCTPGAFSADVTALVFNGGLVETQVNRSLHNIADKQCRLDIVENELYNIGKAVDPFATAAQILRNDTLCADHADVTKNFHNMISVCKTTEAVLDSLQVPACIARAFHPTDSDFSKSVKDTLCVELYESLSRSFAAYTAKLNPYSTSFSIEPPAFNMVRIFSSISFVVVSLALVAVANPMGSTCILNALSTDAKTAVSQANALGTNIKTIVKALDAQCNAGTVAQGLITLTSSTNALSKTLNATGGDCVDKDVSDALPSMQGLCDSITSAIETLETKVDCISGVLAVNTVLASAAKVVLGGFSKAFTDCKDSYLAKLKGSIASDYEKASKATLTVISNFQLSLHLSYISNHLFIRVEIHQRALDH
ncbi:hypothetical protein C8J56DRAFT_1061424 [Mycena floridula]|nr:hypothetical protein C8J56DRAFT_1061424 [Mycena floridula]